MRRITKEIDTEEDNFYCFYEQDTFIGIVEYDYSYSFYEPKNKWHIFVNIYELSKREDEIFYP